MSNVATHKLLFLLLDEQDRSYIYQNGKAVTTTIPTWVKHNPNGWKDMTLQFATNKRYFATLRTFSNAVKFVDDGQAIIADRMINGAGVQEIMHLAILKQDSTMGLNGYRLEYKSRLDFGKWKPQFRTGTSMNTLQDDVFALVSAAENAIYNIPCNSSNPAAIKIAFDGMLLQDKLNYSTLNVPIINQTANNWWAVPFEFINNEGDSVGVIFNSSNFDNFSNPYTYIADPGNANYIVSFNEPTDVTIRGTFVFNWSTNHMPPGGSFLMFMTSLSTFVGGQHSGAGSDGNNGNSHSVNIFSDGNGALIQTKQQWSVAINATIHLAANEKLFLIANLNDNAARHFTITPLATTLSLSFSTKPIPAIVYALRGIDVLKQLVSLITQGKYTADSKFLTSNNRKCITSGSAIRGFPDAEIQTSFADFFNSFTAAYNLALTVRDGVLWIEPVGDIFNANEELINLGEVAEGELEVAQEFIFTSAKVGYQKQQYNKRNGRYEYNCTHNYKFPISSVLNQLNLVSPYRADPFGMTFLLNDYQNLTSTDDKGDKDIFAIMISDTIGQITGEVSTAIAVNIETLILASPVIKTPFSNSVIHNQNPTITGIAQAAKTITIYVDGVIDGTTISDSNGNWSYQVAISLQTLSNTFNGVHTAVAAAQTDPDNVSGFSNVLTIVIDTTGLQSFLITSPTNGDSLYNNLPFVTGTAPSGTAVSLKLDGGTIAIVPANSSGLWNHQVVTPIPDGAHTLTASAISLIDYTINIFVDKNVSSPLITSINYGDIIYNNLPLIKGVAIPGTVVPVYLDGGGGAIAIPTNPLGTAMADINGNWSFQVTTVIDSSGNSTPYIPDGLHIISTTATPVNVPAAIAGYMLMRGSNKGPVIDYDAIRLDDQYIPPGVDPTTLPPTLGQFLHSETLYNIEETTPLRMLRAHDNLLCSFLEQQRGQQIVFNGAEVNANLVTSKNGVVFNEGANVNVNDLGTALFHYFYFNFKAKVPTSFNDIMISINNTGYITAIYKDVPVYCLPIGTMNMKPATDEAQVWKLIISTKTPLSSLLSLFSNGTSINLGKNMIYISDKNPLHIVKYNYTPPAGCHFKDIYDDWQKNRFKRWPLYQPRYVQPFQNNDTIELQVISNGVGSLQAQMISATTGELINTFVFNTVPGSVVQLPNVLLECSIPLANYPEDQYWFALFTGGTIVGISEPIWLKEDWPDTYIFETTGSKDTIDYYYSTGIKNIIRCQAELLIWEPGSEVDNFEDEIGDWEITRSITLNKRTLQLGSEHSLIADWMRLKMNVITARENLLIDGVHYTRDSNSKMESEDYGKGILEFICKIEMVLAENQNGLTLSTPGDGDNVHTTAYVLDATAFGQNAGVINVTVENE